MFFKNSHPILVILSAWCWVGIFAYLCKDYFTITGFLIGFGAYTLNEYFIHAFLFHVIALKLRTPKRLYYMVHGRHHKYPNEYNRVVLPIAHQWGLVVVLTICWYIALFFIEFVMKLLPISELFKLHGEYRFYNTCQLGSGLMFGYSFYEIAHLFSHDYPLLQWFTLIESAKWFHSYHHTHSASKNYGFVSPIWDFIFGTICSESELNPFIKPPFGWNIISIITALPIPFPFYHFIMLGFRNKGQKFHDYGRLKHEQVEYFGEKES